MSQYRNVVVDGAFLCRRAFEANGERALWGAAIGKLLELQVSHRPTVLLFALEGQSGYMRQAFIDHAQQGGLKVKDYKADRKPTPPIFHEAVAELREVLPALGVAQARSVGEADDIAATVARTWMMPTLLWTADKDWFQLVADGVHLKKPDLTPRPPGLPEGERWRGPDTIFTARSIGRLSSNLNGTKVSGLTARGWFNLITLAGKKGEVPGLPGCGPMTAGRILGHCPDFVDLVLYNDEEEAEAQLLGGARKLSKWAGIAADNRPLLQLSRDLATRYTVELEVTPAAPDFDLAEAWLVERDLEYLINRLQGDSTGAAEPLPF